MDSTQDRLQSYCSNMGQCKRSWRQYALNTLDNLKWNDQDSNQGTVYQVERATRLKKQRVLLFSPRARKVTKVAGVNQTTWRHRVQSVHKKKYLQLRSGEFRLLHAQPLLKPARLTLWHFCKTNLAIQEKYLGAQLSKVGINTGLYITISDIFILSLSVRYQIIPILTELWGTKGTISSKATKYPTHISHTVPSIYSSAVKIKNTMNEIQKCIYSWDC